MLRNLLKSPFVLTHGRDPRLPTETLLTFSGSPYAIDAHDYKADLCSSLPWDVARANLKKVQKSYYGSSSKVVYLRPGDRVMVFMPAEWQGKMWKRSRPFHGPYRVLHVTDTNVDVRLVDCPEDDSMFVVEFVVATLNREMQSGREHEIREIKERGIPRIRNQERTTLYWSSYTLPFLSIQWLKGSLNSSLIVLCSYFVLCFK